MDSLTFMYWALGGGFLVLVFFIALALIYVIRILRDVSDATSSVRESAEVMNENVARVAEKVADATDQITEYIIKPVSMAQVLVEKIKPIVDMIQQKSEEMKSGGDEKDSNKKKSVFRKKKK